MLELFYDGLSLFFIISGMLFLITLALIKLSKGEKDGFFIVLKADENTSDLYSRVYAAFSEANMFNFLRVNKVVVIDCGIREREKNECISAFGAGDTLTFITPGEAEAFFSGKDTAPAEDFIC